MSSRRPAVRTWQLWLTPALRFLLRWGWFVLLSIVVAVIASSLIPDLSSTNSYEATLQIQVHLPQANPGTASLNGTTTFFSQILVSPDTLNLALSKYPGVQLADLQKEVTANPVTGTNIVQLNALGNTPQEASQLVMAVYQAFLQSLHTHQSQVINALKTDLQTELQQTQGQINDSMAQLQSLAAINQQNSTQYRQINNLYHEQLKRAQTINDLLVQVGQQDFATNDLLKPGSAIPSITTVSSIGPTQSQRVALSPLIGLIMGIGGVFLASQFSNRLPLRGKKREAILPHIKAVIPVRPVLRRNRLQMLRQTSTICQPLLRQLRYQATEHEQRLQLITVTSPRGREGKSTIATALAIAGTQLGLRTLLVDANPWRPILHTWLQLPNTIGTLESIRGLAAGMTGALTSQNTFVMKLDLLPIGKPQQGSTKDSLDEPLRVDGLRPLAELLCKEHELVVLDGPSLLTEAGTTNLAMFSDMVVLVVDAQSSQSSMVVEAEELLAKMGVSFVTVLNRAQREFVE